MVEKTIAFIIFFLKKNYLKFCLSLCIMMGFYSSAQVKENKSLEQNRPSKTEMESKGNFYDALRFRTDLRLDSNKRILYTSIKNIEAFKQKYKETDMTLDYVIRDRLHTAIFLGQKRNFLESIDGSVFDLQENYPADVLTDHVVSLIGGMYYGAGEVKALAQ